MVAIDSSAVKITPDYFPMEYRSAWLKAFIKYNTFLPSSASVERMFSMASDILTKKRSRLNSHSMERLIFLRGNAKSLGDLLR